MDVVTAKILPVIERPRVIVVPTEQRTQQAPPLIRHWTWGQKKGLWELGENYAVQMREPEGNVIFRIDQGYLYNLASVPRPIWPLINPFELSTLAPLIHDFLYDHEGVCPEWTVTPYRTFTRQEADLIFYALMKREHIPAWRRDPAYVAVRACAPRW